MRRHPEVEIDLVLNDRQVDLIDEGFDVGLRIVRGLPDSTLVARSICPMHLALCAAPAYLRQHGTPAHPDELARHNCMVYSLGDERDTWHFEDGTGKTVAATVKGALTANTSVALRKRRARRRRADPRFDLYRRPRPRRRPAGARAAAVDHPATPALRPISAEPAPVAERRVFVDHIARHLRQAGLGLTHLTSHLT